MSGGQPFAPGERVRLLRLEDEFFSGMEMDPEDVTRLKSLVGLTWTVEDFHAEPGTVELVFTHAPGDPSPLDWEWVWVPPEWIERVE
ncbi:hypothetical protein MESS2_1350018 [Mesorhizobium metallidurans STM 2683]|uniref:Uncharacterized protein n=1 Tax=Mesorhizobium metallidurans STM 2683 TaxID=1297569 RepID=M5EJY9_9HYPH|nr:hypothetical protein MESS2_1350018 [Mesorhizobium metallidurans STM 2683]